MLQRVKTNVAKYVAIGNMATYTANIACFLLKIIGDWV